VDNGAINEPICGACAPGSEISVNCTSSAHRECAECPSGKFSDAGMRCVDCPAGTYASATNSSLCDECTVGKASEAVGATSSVTCEDCVKGKYANPTVDGFYVKCASCPSGTYSDSIGVDASSDATCLRCPDGATSAPGSIAEGDCQRTCPAGTTGPDGGDCVVCEANKYKEIRGDYDCLQCPPNSASEEMSRNLTDCKCIGGYTGPDGGSCNACEAGKFKIGGGDGECQECPRGKYSGVIGLSSHCDSCEAGKYSSELAAISITACQDCGAGKYSPVVAANSSATCENCVAGTYSEQAVASSNHTCQQCDAGKYSDVLGSPSATTCRDCAEGKYLESGGPSAEACIDCPAGKHLPTSGGDAENSCLACSPGTYSSQLGSSSCTECQAFATSKNSSTSEDDCFCNPGYVGRPGNTCVACDAGKYFSLNNCTECPVDATSPVASVSLSQCACRPGFTGLVLYGNRSNCTACPRGSFGVGGSLPCQACAPGSYSVAAASEACEACPAHSFSSARGSTSASSCTCLAGFSGPAGGPCVLEATPIPQIKDEAPAFAETDIVVAIVLGLPMSVDDFTDDKKLSFRKAIADAAGVGLSKVRIASIRAAGRRRQLLAESIEVEVEVAAADGNAANAVANNLTPDKINAKLQEAGLPQVAILRAAKVQTPVIVEEEPTGTNPGVVVGIVFGVLTALALAGALYICVFRSKTQSSDGKQAFGYRAQPYDEEDSLEPDARDGTDDINVMRRVCLALVVRLSEEVASHCRRCIRIEPKRPRSSRSRARLRGLHD